MTDEEVRQIMKRDMPGWKISHIGPLTATLSDQGAILKWGTVEKAVEDDMPAFKARYKLPPEEPTLLVWVEMAGGPKAVILAQGRVIGFQG